ncbi:MAG TPA: DUF302 domain-containing protein [Aliidongia sp.]|nr:DUF302 domain-containing protein [Aliidongia sp.]
MRLAIIARRSGLLLAALLLLLPGMLLSSTAARAQEEPEMVGPYPGTFSWPTDYSFHELLGKLEKSVAANGMTVLAVATAQRRAPPIPANATVLVFRNDYAARIMEADLLAGMEAPIRLYVTESANRKAAITYRTPSSILALYDNPKLDALALELDQIFAKIVDDALKG